MDELETITIKADKFAIDLICEIIEDMNNARTEDEQITVEG